MAYYCFEVEFAQTQPQNIQKFNLLIGWPVQHRLHRWTSSWKAIFSITHWPPKIKVTMFNVLYFKYFLSYFTFLFLCLLICSITQCLFVNNKPTDCWMMPYSGLNTQNYIFWLHVCHIISDIKILQTHFRSVNVKRVVQTKHIFSPCFMLVGLWR